MKLINPGSKNTCVSVEKGFVVTNPIIQFFDVGFPENVASSFQADV
jgi:hypothetical protein